MSYEKKINEELTSWACKTMCRCTVPDVIEFGEHADSEIEELKQKIEKLEEALRDLLNDCINFRKEHTESLLLRVSDILKGD